MLFAVLSRPSICCWRQRGLRAIQGLVLLPANAAPQGSRQLETAGGAAVPRPTSKQIAMDLCA